MRSNRNKITLAVFVIAAVAASFLYFSSYTSIQIDRENSSYNIQNKRRELYRDIYRGTALLIYPSSDSLKYIGQIKGLTGNFGRINLRIKPDIQVTASDLRDNSIILLGTFSSNKILRKISPALPVMFSGNEFKFEGDAYGKSADLINLFYYNPYNKKKLCYIISGNDDEYIAGHIDLRSVGDLRISEGGQCAAMGFFKIDRDGNWEVDNSSFRDFNMEKKDFNFPDGVSYTVYSKDLKRLEIEKINEERESSLKKMKLFFGKNISRGRLHYFVYDNFEDKGLISGDTRLENVDWRDSSVQFVYNDLVNGNDFSGTALLLLRKNFGPAKSSFIENGLSIYFSNNWRKKGYGFWAAMIAKSLSIPPLDEMLDNNSIEYLSPFFTEPLGGEFIKFLIKEKGSGWLIKNYNTLDAQNVEALNIADKLGRKVTALGPTRSQLIAKGMVYSPSHGDTAFTVPLFDEFMKRIMPGEDWNE